MHICCQRRTVETKSVIWKQVTVFKPLLSVVSVCKTYLKWNNVYRRWTHCSELGRADLLWSKRFQSVKLTGYFSCVFKDDKIQC